MKKIVLVDDLDGSSEAEETVSFGFDGNHYEIDLNAGNAKELRTLFARYATVARPTRKASGASKKETPASSATKTRRPVKRQANGGVPESSAVRAWAKSKGVEVPGKGRISKAVVQQYLADVSS